MLKRVFWFVLATCVLTTAHAHDIPADVRLNIFFKPAGNKLEVLVRAPMAALREVDFPKRGPGYLEVSKADAALRSHRVRAGREYLGHNSPIEARAGQLQRCAHAGAAGTDDDNIKFTFGNGVGHGLRSQKAALTGATKPQ